LLNIPEYLTTDPKHIGVKQYYARYKALIRAVNEVQNRFENGTWPGVRPTQTEVVEIFVSKSQYHDYMTKGFDDISNYPVLKEWLEGGENSPTNISVWGFEKPQYSFNDLMEEKERMGNKKIDKGKSKGTKGKGKEGEGDDKEAKKSKKKKSKTK